MERSLTTFMKLAFTAVLVTVLVFGILYVVLDEKTVEYEQHIHNLQIQKYK